MEPVLVDRQGIDLEANVESTKWGFEKGQEDARTFE